MVGALILAWASFAHLLLYHNWTLASIALLCSSTHPDRSRDTLGWQQAVLPQPRCVQRGISSFTAFLTPLCFSICAPRAWVTKTEIQSAEIRGESAKKAETG